MSTIGLAIRARTSLSSSSPGSKEIKTKHRMNYAACRTTTIDSNVEQSSPRSITSITIRCSFIINGEVYQRYACIGKLLFVVALALRFVLRMHFTPSVLIPKNEDANSPYNYLFKLK